MRTGWKVLLCLIAAAVLSTAALSALEPLTDQAATRNYLSRQLGVNIGDCPVLRDRDTHGGFHGDGERLIVADCSSRRAELLEQTAAWPALPLTGNLARAALGIPQFPDGLTEDGAEGRYWFLDRHSQAEDPHDPSGLYGRYSSNYTLAVYDAASDRLYYYELDT